MSPTPRRMLDGPRSTFQIGDALSQSFSVWGKNLLPLLVVTAVTSIPTLLILRETLRPHPEQEAALWNLALSFSGSVMSILATGAITYAVVQQMRGRPCGVGEAISVGLSRFFPVIGTALLAMLAIVGGLLLLVVPGIIVSLMLSVAVPVAIIEHPGVVASLKRSAALTRGIKGQLFVMFLLIGLVTGFLGFAVGMGLRTSGLTTQWIVHGALQVVAGSFGAVLPAVVYVLLRSAREGANIEDVAKVFD